MPKAKPKARKSRITRNKVYGDVTHCPGYTFSIGISTNHTRDGGPFWMLSPSQAKKLMNQIDKALVRELEYKQSVKAGAKVKS